MGKIVKDGIDYSGTSGQATSVSLQPISGMSATNVQEGFAEINSNLTADGTPFRFGKDEEGNFGYILTDETGADSVIPFKNINFLLIDGAICEDSIAIVTKVNIKSISNNGNGACKIVGNSGSAYINYKFKVLPNMKYIYWIGSVYNNTIYKLQIQNDIEELLKDYPISTSSSAGTQVTQCIPISDYIGQTIILSDQTMNNTRYCIIGTIFII